MQFLAQDGRQSTGTWVRICKRKNTAQKFNTQLLGHSASTQGWLVIYTAPEKTK